MATLYVEDIPDDLYEALRKRAKSQGRSVAAEVRALLAQSIPTEKELKKRREFLLKLDRLRFTAERSDGSFPTSEEMIREDRDR
jgi:plasmid stability protein